MFKRELALLTAKHLPLVPQALRADQMTRFIEANPLIQQAIIGLLVALVLAMWGP
jgi:hypothetical protein